MFGSSTKPETDKAKPASEEGRSKMSPTGPVTETSSQAAAGGDTADRRRAKTLVAREGNIVYGDFHAVENVNMTIEPNKVTALIGSSGCGKTTFLRSLNRMHELHPGASVKGDIELDGEDISAK